MAHAVTSAPKGNSNPDSQRSRTASPSAPIAQMKNEQSGCSCGGGCPRCVGPRVERSVGLESEAKGAASEYREMRRAAGSISIRRVPKEARSRSDSGESSQAKRPARWKVARGPRPDRALGEGKALERKSREDFEAFFDADFCAVRLHTGPPADAITARYGTRALAFGNHILVSSEAPSLNSEEGLALVAHELTHCLQQSAESREVFSAAVPNRGPPFTRLSGLVLQGFDIELPTLSEVGDAVGNVGDAAWDTVSDAGEAVVDFAAENLETAVEYLAPGLMDFINGGLGTQLTELFCTGIDALLGALLSPLEELDMVSAVESTFSSLAEGVRGMWSGLGGGASAALGTVLRPMVEALQIFDGPLISGITAAADTAQGIFTGLWDNIGVPVLDFLESVGGAIWEGFQNVYKWLERITRPIRETAGELWSELMRRFNLAWDNTSDMRQSIADEASELWDGFLETIEPIKGPVMVVGGALLLLSPLGPIIILTQVIPPLWDKLVWLWNNWNTEEILVQAKEVLANDILPGILGVISGVSSALAGAVSWLSSTAKSVATAFSSVFEAFGLGRCLAAVTRILDHVAGEFQDFADWAEGGFTGLGDAIEAVFDALVAIFEPILDFLVRLLIVAANPPMLPIALTAVIWLLCPDDLKPPVINFVLDILIQVLRAMPTFMPGLWPLASLMKGAALGFMASLRIQSDEMKIAASNKIAGLMAGGGIAFVAGFAVGLLRGIIDGILDPFRIIWMLIRLVMAVCRAVGTVIARLSSTAAGIGARARRGLGLQTPAEQPGMGAAFLTDLGFGESSTPAAQPAAVGAGAGAGASPSLQTAPARGPPASVPGPTIVTHENSPEFARLTGIRPPSGPTEAVRETATDAQNQSAPAAVGSEVVSGESGVEAISTTTTFSEIGTPGQVGVGSEIAPSSEAAMPEGDGNPIADLLAQGPLPSDEDVLASLSPGSGGELLGAAAGLEGADSEAEEGFGNSVEEAGGSPRSLAEFLGGAWDAAVSGATGLGASMAEALLGFIMLPDYQLGNKLGFVTGFVLFQIILAYLTAGISTAGSAASPILRAVVGFLDLGGQILGLAGRALARLAVPIGKVLSAGGKFLGKIPGVSGIFNRFAGALRSLMRVGGDAAGAVVGAARKVTDPLGEAAMRGAGLPTSAIDDVMGRGGRALAGEGGERAVVEGTQTAGSRAGSTAGREGAEASGSRAAREAEESAVGRAGREGEEAAARQSDDALKAAELPAAQALARGICESNDALPNSPHPALVVVQLAAALSRYRWIDTFGFRRRGPGIYRIYFTASPPHDADDHYTSGAPSTSAADDAAPVEVPAASASQTSRMMEDIVERRIDNLLDEVHGVSGRLDADAFMKYLDEISETARRDPDQAMRMLDALEDSLVDARRLAGSGSSAGAAMDTAQPVSPSRTPGGRRSTGGVDIEDDVASSIMTPAGTTRAGLARAPRHHALPQEHIDFFQQRGFAGRDIDNFTLDLDQAVHQAIHGGGNWRLGRRWNGEWNSAVTRRLRDQEAIKGSHLTRDEILDEVRVLMQQYGLDDQFIHYAAPRGARFAVGPAPAKMPDSVELALRRRGEKLPSDLQVRASSRFGESMDSVRLHKGQPAAQAVKESNAEAVTFGNDILLGADHQDLAKARSLQVLGHELAHTTQKLGEGAEDASFVPDHSPEEHRAEQAESLFLPTPSDASGRGGGGGEEGDEAAPDPVPDQDDEPGGQQQAPPAVSDLTVNFSQQAAHLAHVPACGNQPTIRFTAGPSSAAPIDWAVADGTATVASGTELTPSTDTLTAELALGTAQAAGTLDVSARNQTGGKLSQFPLASHPTGIDSTVVVGDPTTANRYGGVFDHGFASHSGPVSSLFNVAIGERFPNLPNPDTAVHTFDTPFGEFELHTGTLPDTPSQGAGNWFPTLSGDLGDDNVTFAKSLVDLGKHLVSDSNPTPTNPLPAEFVIDQDFHWWCPHAASGSRWTKFTSTTHTRRLEINSADEAVFKAIVNGEENAMTYEGTTGVRNATATPSSSEASVPDETAKTVTISAEMFPSGRSLHFSIEGAALGCTIDSTSGVLTIGQQAGAVTVRAADSNGGSNWDEVNVTISAPPAPAPTPPEEDGESPTPAPPDSDEPS